MRYHMLRLALVVWVICLFAPLSLQGTELGKAAIREDGSVLRERPDVDSDAIVGVARGQAVLIILCLKDTDTVMGVNGRWCLVRYRGVEGWAFDAALDTGDPQAESSYRDVPSLAEESDRLGQLRESHKLEAAERLSALIIGQVEQNFTRQEILDSGRLSGTLLSSFAERIEALIYLHRFDEARETYDYVMKVYPDIRVEGDLGSARDMLKPYEVFLTGYSSAPLFRDADEPTRKLKAALEKRDLSAVSDLAIPGIFEMWVANTDWVVKLGEERLSDQEWLARSWKTSWTVKEVSPRTDSAGKPIGYCIVTEPWNVNYYEIQTDRIDFCVDRLPDGSYAFSYLILYTEPIQ